MDIIDVHTHLSKLENSKFENATSEELLVLLRKQMQQAGVSHAIIIPNFDKNQDDRPLTGDVIELIDDIDELSTMGSIDIINYTEDDILQLEDWLKKDRIVGVKLYPGYQHFYPGDDRCRPIYELCTKYKKPVVFHSGDTLVYDRQAKVKYAHPLHVDDVAVEFSDLMVVIAHLGNPWMVDCAEVLYRNDNVYVDVSGLTVRGNLKGAYADLTRERIKNLIAYSGADRLMFGTDWPLADLAPYVEYIQTLNFDEETVKKVFYQNAIEVFGLDL